MSHPCKTNKLRSAVTLPEILIGAVILSIIGGIIAHWFFMQRQYQQRIFAISDSQQAIRKASWRMMQELRTGRSIIFPRINADKSIRSDDKILFKAFNGDITCFYFVPETSEIRRCIIPNGPGSPQIDPDPVAAGVKQVAFTARDDGNRLVDIFLNVNGTFGLESVFLLNE